MDKAGLLQLPGRPEEQAWLRERLEMLTVREGIVLDIILRNPHVRDTAVAVKLLG